MEKYCGGGNLQRTIWRSRNACWILKATNTHSEYVILTAFPLQQYVHEGACLLRCYVICLSCSFMYTPQIELVLSKLARLLWIVTRTAQ